MQATMDDVCHPFPAGLAVADQRPSPISVPGTPVLHTRLGIRWSGCSGVFIVPIPQLASFVTRESLTHPGDSIKAYSRAGTTGADVV